MAEQVLTIAFPNEDLLDEFTTWLLDFGEQSYLEALDGVRNLNDLIKLSNDRLPKGQLLMTSDNTIIYSESEDND